MMAAPAENACQGWPGDASAEPEDGVPETGQGVGIGPRSNHRTGPPEGCRLSLGFGRFTHMAINPDSALENLTRLVQVIGPDRELRQWFSALARKSAVERRNEIYLACERMRAAGQDADLVVSFRLLADARVFAAVSLALQEHDPAA